MGRIAGVLLSIVLVQFLAGDTIGPRPTLSPASRDYLDYAVTTMQEHALDRVGVNWVDVRAKAFALASGAREPAQTYPAIEYVIDALGNPHTNLVRPHDAAHTLPASSIAVPSARLLVGRFALLTIPGLPAGPQVELRYLQAGMAAVREVDRSGPCGWIVDLRQNGGGNMWPMIAVLAPLLGAGPLGSFVFPDGTSSEWRLSDGRPMLGETSMTGQANPVRLTRPDPPVAVLTSRVTASAGEAVLIAFRGLDRVRTFGSRTAGLATANEIYPLSDGALLVLTTALDADRTGRLYGNDPIPPDEQVPMLPDYDAALGSATAWLNARPGCQ